jgi:hypothetical protein
VNLHTRRLVSNWRREREEEREQKRENDNFLFFSRAKAQTNMYLRYTRCSYHDSSSFLRDDDNGEKEKDVKSGEESQRKRERQRQCVSGNLAREK